MLDGDPRTIGEFVEAARRALPPALWDHAMGGAEDEATLRRNRLALESLTFNPGVLRGVGSVDIGTSFLGRPLARPFMLAPIGSIGLFHPDGALATARVAARTGTVSWVSTFASPSLEDVARCPGPHVFQLYVRGDHGWVEALVRRVERAGYAALCLTVDSAVYGRRERDLRHRSDPRERHRPNVAATGLDAARGAAFTWRDLAWLRELTRLPLLLKGVMTGEDARLAVEHGCQAVCVSNHGGRQLDYLPATIEVLPEVLAAVGGRAEVLVDGGFLRGTDVLKALAVGARSVLLGKATVLGLAAAGEAGLERLLDLLADELRAAMALVGARGVHELSPSCVRWPDAGLPVHPGIQPRLLPL